MEGGVNFFDTANVYNQGASESIVGKVFKGRRDKIVLASKARGKMGEGPDQSGCGRAAIVRAIVGVANSLGLMLVAEGIESAEQLECLRKLGCECGQGFFFSPSVSAEACRNVLWQLRGPRPSQEVPKLRLLNPVS